jgi:myo-inositol 2-dehydrogenase / D-chiro-inositol 1-dehydrogenase
VTTVTIVNYGMVGCGMMGQEHLRNLAMLPGARVCAIFELNEPMRDLCRALVPQARFVDSLEALLAQPDLQALVIASPNHHHAQQLMQIAAQKPLPVLMEKPACTDLADVAALRRLVATYPAPLWTAMEYRYMPPIAAFIQQVRQVAVTGGTAMLSIREHRYPFLDKVDNWNRFDRNTGGTLVEKCCHFFDLMRLIIGRDPVRVFACGGQNHNHRDERYAEGRPDILDNAYVIVDFGQGQRAMLDLCMFAEGSRYQEHISVVGPLGKVECFIPGPTRFWPEASLGPAPVAQLIVSPRAPQGPRIEEIPVDAALLAAGDHNGSTFYQHQGFFNAVTHGGPVEVSLEDGLKAVVIGLAAEHSARSGEAVDLTRGPYALT